MWLGNYNSLFLQDPGLNVIRLCRFSLRVGCLNRDREIFFPQSLPLKFRDVRDMESLTFSVELGKQTCWLSLHVCCCQLSLFIYQRGYTILFIYLQTNLPIERGININFFLLCLQNLHILNILCTETTVTITSRCFTKLISVLIILKTLEFKTDPSWINREKQFQE